jgi:hypothetical protein
VVGELATTFVKETLEAHPEPAPGGAAEANPAVAQPAVKHRGAVMNAAKAVA